MEKEEAEIMMNRVLGEIPRGVVIMVDDKPQEGSGKESRITHAWKGVDWEEQIGILGETLSSVLAIGILHYGVNPADVINKLMEHTHKKMKYMEGKKMIQGERSSS